MVGRAFLCRAARFFGLLQSDLCILRIRAHGLNLFTKPRDFSSRIPQLFGGAECIAFGQFSRMTLCVQLRLQTRDFLVGSRRSVFGITHREIATLDFFTPLAGAAPREGHLFRFGAATDCLPRQDVYLSLRLMHAQGAFGLLQVGLGGTQFVGSIALGSRVTRQIHSLTRTQ